MTESTRPFLNTVRVTLLSSATAVMALAVAFTQFAHAKAGKTESKGPPPKVAVDTNPLKRETRLTTSFAPVVKKVAPSVVNVFISSTPKTVSFNTPPMLDEPFFRRFFGDDFSPGSRNGKQHIPKQRGLGSGVVVTKGRLHFDQQSRGR